MTALLPPLPSNVPLTLVVPVYNDVERLAEHGDELVNFVRTFGPGSGLVVVDDGSTDHTCEVAEDLEARSARTGVRLRRCYNRLLRLTVTAGIHDTQCGAKVAATAGSR